MNYIAHKVNFETLPSEGNTERIMVDGVIYTANYDHDPEYIDDGVLNISYFRLYDTDDNYCPDYILAFDPTNNPDAEEWNDQYDIDNMYVLKFT